MEKIKNIEFLRLVGCIAIILLHIFAYNNFANHIPDASFYKHMKIMTHDGQKAVELFFILSGCFFAITFNKTLSIWDFIKKKLIRLYPVLIFVMLLYFVLSLFHIVKFDLYNNIMCLFGLNGTYLTLRYGNIGVFWYVSIMFWVLLLYHYILKNYDKKHVKLFAFLSVFFCYGFLIHAKDGKINNIAQTFDYIYHVGTLRGLGGISCGYLIGDWFKNNIEHINNFIPSINQKLFITLAEFICLYFIINNLMLHGLKYCNDVIFVVTFTVIIVLFLIKKGFISQWLDKEIFSKLSKYVYSLYMTHKLIIEIYNQTLWKNYDFVHYHPLLNIFATLIPMLILGILTYHLIEKPCAKFLKRNSQQ